ncbi:MAG: hypothetical protein II499_02705 [Firmicutes bacterium]|nr:hypothetical protein [Bacillota bacterium]
MKFLRRLIEQLSEHLTDEEAMEAVELFPAWAARTEYTADTRVRYAGLLYRCVQAHTSQDDWTPDLTPALWARVDDPAEEWPEWRQPTGAQDAYPAGAKVSHNEKHWISTTAANVWEPGVYGWEEAV